MSMHRAALITASASLLLVLIVKTGGAAAQAPPAPNATIAALLTEVHELRLAIERSATTAPRVQLTLARLNIQEQRTVVLSGQLDQVRQGLMQASLETKSVSSELEDVQKVLQTPRDDAERKAWQAEAARLTHKLAQQAAVEERLRARESEAAQLLGTEQARWIELNARLDELERLLGPVR
jgi:hypothetical protein